MITITVNNLKGRLRPDASGDEDNFGLAVRGEQGIRGILHFISGNTAGFSIGETGELYS